MSGRTELAPGYSISRIIHGGWQFSAGHRLGGPELDDALEVLCASAELGVTTFDCADIYTGVEELYGRFLRRWRSTSAATPIQVHTKFVPDYDDLPRVDARYVERVIDRSLGRLGVDTLDLVQFYWWRDEVPGMEDAGLALRELQTAGKIRHVGATNLSAARLERLRQAGVATVANQVQYSVLDRRPEHGLVEYALARDVGLICYGALAGGLLTDRWSGRAAPDAPESRSLTKYLLMVDECGGWTALQSLLALLREIADERGVDVGALALRFVLDQPGVAAVVVGATRLDQMARNVRALALELAPGDHDRIRAALASMVGPAGDVFELERDREGAHGRIMRYNLNREGAPPT